MRFVLFLALMATTSFGVDERQLYFVQVERAAKIPFYNRFSDGAFHYAVVPQLPSQGVVAAKPVVDHGGLHLVESRDAKGAPLPGEVAGFGPVRLVEVPRGQDPHVFLGSHRDHAEPVGARLFTDETPSSPKVRLPGEGSKSSLNIDRDYMQMRLRELAGEVPVEVDGEIVTLSERRSPAGREVARGWLAKELKSLGYEVSEHGYGDILFAGTNLVAKRDVGTTDDFVIVSAHYDSVGNQGVDDDGTGVVTAMTALAAINDMALAVDVYFVAFDQEELGLIGSRAYADALAESSDLDRLIGVVNLEMTGYDGDDDGALHVIHCEENSSAELAAFFTTAVDDDDLALQDVAACTNRSDHASFWRHNKPAIVLSQNFFGGDGNPCYHRSCDRLDGVDLDYMERVTTAVARGLAMLVAAPGN